MIKKNLVVYSGQAFLLTGQIEAPDPTQGLLMVEILMPIKVFWECTKLLGHAYFLSTDEEETNARHETYRRFFQAVAPYAVNEADRDILRQRGQMPNPLKLR